MRRRPGEILMHTRYLTWSTKAVAAANRDWRARGGFGDMLLTRAGLHFALHRWAVEEGLIDKAARDMRSFLVAKVFKDHPEQVKAAARDYWRTRRAEAEAFV